MTDKVFSYFVVKSLLSRAFRESYSTDTSSVGLYCVVKVHCEVQSWTRAPTAVGHLNNCQLYW